MVNIMLRIRLPRDRPGSHPAIRERQAMTHSFDACDRGDVIVDHVGFELATPESEAVRRRGVLWDRASGSPDEPIS